MEYLFYGNTREKIEEYHHLSHKPEMLLTDNDNPKYFHVWGDAAEHEHEDVDK